MYKTITAFLFCVITAMAFQVKAADEIRPNDILFLEYIEPNNISSINVLGTTIHIGDSFRAGANLLKSLRSDIRLIQVINDRTGETLRITTKELNKETNNFYSAYIKHPRTGTKGISKKEAITDMSVFLNDTFYFSGDLIVLYSSLPIDNEHTFLLRPVESSYGLPFELKYDTDDCNMFVITKEMLLKNNIDIESAPQTFHVEYIGDGKSIFITDNFTLEFYNQFNNETNNF